MSQIYREVGNRRYEYRIFEDDRWTKWTDAGDASPETLAKITGPLEDCEYEVREYVALVNEMHVFIGELRFAPLVCRHEP